MHVHLSSSDHLLDLVDLLARRGVDASVEILDEANVLVRPLRSATDGELLQFRLDVRSFVRYRASEGCALDGDEARPATETAQRPAGARPVPSAEPTGPRVA